MSSRNLLLGLAVTCAAVPVADAATTTAPRTRTPEQAVAAVKRIVVRVESRCDLDWHKINAKGFEGNWNITVSILGSKSGSGTARWHIGGGWPVAVNPLAVRLAHGCRPGDTGRGGYG